MKKILKSVLLGSLVVAQTAFAEENTRDRRGFFPFLGLSLGYQKLSTDVTGEVSKSGMNWGPRLVGSYYAEDWVFDGGMGYNLSRLSGSGDNGDVSMDTDSFTLELAPRYRMGDYAQLGPTLNLWMGTDESYEESVGDSSSMGLVGLQMLFDIPSAGSMLYRVGFGAMRSLNLEDRSTMIFMADLQIGYDLFDNLKTKKAPPPEPEPEPVQPEVVEAPIAKVTDQESVLVTFPEDRLLFAYKMSHLDAARRAYLAEFGKFLASRPETWESVIVTGHTDNRGSVKVNDELSEARARTVFDVLGEQNIPRDRMSYKGMGFRKPIDAENNEAAWKVNRRVELEFHGVKDPNLFSEEFNRIDRNRPAGGF